MSCELCSAVSWVEVEFSTGVLEFCGHHYREHEDGLLASAINVVDKRGVPADAFL